MASNVACTYPRDRAALHQRLKVDADLLSHAGERALLLHMARSCVLHSRHCTHMDMDLIWSSNMRPVKDNYIDHDKLI